MLVCAMNPCRCGWFGHPSGRCTCTDSQVQSYLRRISGPLLDRIDMHVEVPSVEYEAMRRKEQPESSQQVRSRVNAARQVQQRRYEVPASPAMLYDPRHDRAVLSAGYRRGEADAGGLRPAGPDRPQPRPHPPHGPHHRRSGGEEQILPAHLAEAIQYRSSAMLK